MLSRQISILLLLLCPLFLYIPEAHAFPFFKSHAYNAKIEGEIPGSMKDLLESVSQTFSLRDRAVPTAGMLKKRASLDIPDMIKVLRSEGYYDGSITVDIQTTGKVPLVIFLVDTGPAYLINEISVEDLREGGEEKFYPTADDLGLTVGMRARAGDVLKGEELLRNFLKDHGVPMPRAYLEDAIVNHDTRTMDVFYVFRAETLAFYGDVTITGTKKVNPLYIEKSIPWKKGHLFRISQINTLKNNLMQGGLFSMVDVRYMPDRDRSHERRRNPDRVDAINQDKDQTVDRDSNHANIPDKNKVRDRADNRETEKDRSARMAPAQNAPPAREELPIEIRVQERKPRTVRAGLFYETETGMGVSFGWEHRNLHGMGELLSLDARIVENENRAVAQYRIQDFFARNQTLTLSAALSQEETDSYDSDSAGAGIKLYRQLNRRWGAGIGIRYRIADVTQLGETETYGLFSVPMEVNWDRRNDFLNPSSGVRIQMRGEPFYDTMHTDNQFTRLVGNASLYFPLLEEDRLVLAVRGGVGSIVGQSNLNIPADERFYGGGGGSIRGYKYQGVGPEERGVVIGGRSMIETSIELRYRMQNNMGFVAFLDGGQVDPSSTPQFDKEFQWGAGVGFRYYTSFAPFRIDFGFPLNGRDQDDPVQMYISIGQAF